MIVSRKINELNAIKEGRNSVKRNAIRAARLFKNKRQLILQIRMDVETPKIIFTVIATKGLNPKTLYIKARKKEYDFTLGDALKPANGGKLF